MNLEQKLQKSRERHAKPVKKNATWVKVTWIMDLTGWNKEKMRQAREEGLVEYKEEGKSLLYNLESIHPLFIRKPVSN